jgi:hypothetical protein
VTLWDEEMAALASVAKFCDHVWERGFCAKCGWERGSLKKMIYDGEPGTSTPESVSPPFSDQAPGLPDQKGEDKTEGKEE